MGIWYHWFDGPDESLLSFCLWFILPIVVEIVLLKVAFNIFDRTVFDRSVPSSPVQWPMDLSLEVKRMSFPVVFVAIQSLARTMLNGLVAIGGDDLLEELLADAMIGDTVGIHFEQFQLIVNVLVPLIMLIPIIITAISCICTEKRALVRFLSLLAVVALAAALIGSILDLLIYFVLLAEDTLGSLFSILFTLVSVIVSVGGTVLFYATLLIWIIPSSWLEFFGFMQKQNEEMQRMQAKNAARRAAVLAHQSGSSSSSNAGDSTASDMAFYRMPTTIYDDYGKAWHRTDVFPGFAIYQREARKVEISSCNIDGRTASGEGSSFHW